MRIQGNGTEKEEEGERESERERRVGREFSLLPLNILLFGIELKSNFISSHLRSVPKRLFLSEFSPHKN